MTTVLKEDVFKDRLNFTFDDKIYTIYRQYKALIHKDAHENDNHVYGTDQLAANLTVAHMLDHVVGSIKEDALPTAKNINYGPTIRTE